MGNQCRSSLKYLKKEFKVSIIPLSIIRFPFILCDSCRSVLSSLTYYCFDCFIDLFSDSHLSSKPILFPCGNLKLETLPSSLKAAGCLLLVTSFSIDLRRGTWWRLG